MGGGLKLASAIQSAVWVLSRARVGLPWPNKSAIRVLSKHGFSQYSKSIRMTFGKRIVEQPSGIFAIGGAMKG
jgi:hypothetical protein